MTELIHQTDPAAYRLARRNGELILQGAYRWQQGSMGGHEWVDIPIVELDEPEPKPEEPPPETSGSLRRRCLLKVVVKGSR